MNAVFTILTVLIILASLLLIGAVLLQNLEKITWGLVVFILVVSIIASFSARSKSAGVDITDQIENTEAAAAQPEFPTAPIQQEAPTE